jgi:hypothetical protein
LAVFTARMLRFLTLFTQHAHEYLPKSILAMTLQIGFKPILNVRGAANGSTKLRHLQHLVASHADCRDLARLQYQTHFELAIRRH